MAGQKYYSEPLQKIKFLSKSTAADEHSHDSLEETNFESAEAETDSSTLSIDMEEEVFSLGYMPLDIFAQKLKAHLKKIKENKAKLRYIDLGKNGYVTDAIIRCLIQIIGKKKLSRIVKISLEGCTLLTDLGIYWLVQGLSKNKNKVQMNINGCLKIKDGGFATLATALNIGYIEAMATSVSHSCHAGNTQGCPLLINPSNQKTDLTKDSCLVIIPMATKDSLSAFLDTKTASRRKPFHYLNAVEMSTWRISLVELEQNHVLFDHMLPPCPVHVVITFDASCDIQQLKRQVVDTIAHVLSKETPNPKHSMQKTTSLGQSNCFMGGSMWNKCTFSSDGILRNISSNSKSVGAVVSRQQMSRSHNYFEVQCLSCQPETGMLLGVMHDILLSERFPMEFKKCNEGVDLEAGAVYGFGITGKWESEHVPSEDAALCITKNGIKLVSTRIADKAHDGLFPYVSLIGSSSAEVKLLNQACPPEEVIQQWEEKGHYWTPTYWRNILCDDRGILSYVRNDHTDKNVGVMLCQEEITRTHNTFGIQVIEMSSGFITVGLGPEDYALSQEPGLGSMSVALRGDTGKIHLDGKQSVVPYSEKCLTWNNGDEIKAVVSHIGEGETILLYDEIQVDFYVNSLLVGSVKHKITGGKTGVRFVFMVGLKGAGVKARILNHRPLYMTQPPRLDMLTMGRCYFMNIYDDGRILYRKFGSRDTCALFLSKTPFSAKLTYFKLKVTNLSQNHHACIGFGHRDYPANKMLGCMPGSVGYHAASGQLYHCGSTGDSIPAGKEGKHSLCFGSGDTVGCGFSVKSARFRKDGSLENQQILKFYFTKNEKKVLKVDFEYLSDGIYPGANFSTVGDEMVLSNYYPGSECGDFLMEDDTKSVSIDREVAQKKDTYIEGCRFTLVGVGDEGSDTHEKIQTLQEMLNEGFEFPMLPVIDAHIQEMESQPGSMDLQDQQLYGQLCWQKECMERFLSNKSRLTCMSIGVSSGQGYRELVDHIVQVCEDDQASHSWYYNLLAPVNVGLHKITTTLTTMKLMAANELMDLVGTELGQNGRTFEAAIRHLQAKGQLLSFPFKRTVIALDIPFAETLIHMTEALPDILSGRIAPCLGEKTHIWNSVADIFPDLQQISVSKTELLNHVLQCLGVMRIPRLRVHKNDAMFCYCTSNTLGDLPVQLSDFIENATENVVLIGRDYHFLYNNPSHILSMIASRCMQFFRVLAISRSWSVFQSGAAQTVIYITGGHGLKLETRCFMPSQWGGQIDGGTKYHVEEYAYNIYCIFTDLIDHLITKLKTQVIYKEQVPPNLVNSSIGCIHHWGLSSQTFRQTVCTLCGQCCDRGQNCPYNGLGGQYQHQCGCNTKVTGCKDCGICQNCADQLWTIRSDLRPNLEVASYNRMKNNAAIPLNSTTYDEVEFTNLGVLQTPICLKMTTGQFSASAPLDHSGPIVKMFPGVATVFPSQQSLLEDMTALNYSAGISKLMTLEQGDTITVKLDPIKRNAALITEVKEESPPEITPVYFTSKCQNTKIWHETGIVAYTGTSAAKPVGLCISASPLTPACPSFSIQILNYGKKCSIAVGVCHKRFSSDSLPGWTLDSIGYHAADGSIFTGSDYASKQVDACLPGDIMKCELNFKRQSVLFYKNDKLVYESERIAHFGNYHAAVGFHSPGEAVCLLEKEPWLVAADEEPRILDAFDSYSYGNMQLRRAENPSNCPYRRLTVKQTVERVLNDLGIKKLDLGYDLIETKTDEDPLHRAVIVVPIIVPKELIFCFSPGKTITLINCGEELSAWLMIHNPSKSIVGYKVLSPLVPDFGGWLKPSMSEAFLLQASLKKVEELSENELFIDVHWFFMESSHDYTDFDIEQVYSTTTPESLLKHHLEVKIKEVQTDSQPLKLASQEPDENDHYLAEVFKNGISVLKYWLMGGNYIFCLPQKCNVLVRYPKFPTLCQPNGFQKGMRVVVDLTSALKDLYAEAVIEEVTPGGDLRLHYSSPEEEVNSCIDLKVTSPEIALKSTEHEQVQEKVDAKRESDANGKKRNDTKLATAKVSALNIIAVQSRGNIAASKRAYTFPPFHLLTEASQAAVLSLDHAWKANTLISVAQCKTLPTRLTVQELQISQLVGSNVDWLVGATQARTFDLAFAFLPLKLGYKELCYPKVPSMFTEIDVYRLCFLVDQMYFNIHLAKKYNMTLDAPLHFANVAAIPPSSPLSIDVTFASAFTGWTYSTLYSNKLYLPLCDNIFPEGKPDLSRNELEQLMKSLIHMYAAQCHIFAEQHGGIMFEATPENGSQIITASIEHMDGSVVKKTDKTELSSDTLIRKKFRNNVYCKAHQWCLPVTNIIMKEEFNFRSELFTPYEETVNLIVCEMARVTCVRTDFYSFFANLQYLELQSCEQLKELPNGISKCLRLEMLSLKNSAIEVLPADLFQTPSLIRLHCVDLKVQALPASIIDPSPITELILANLLLTSVPKELGNLSNLEYLNLNSNPLDMLPMELRLLTKLKTLLLCGIPWIVTEDSKIEMPLDQFEDFLKTNSSLKHYIGKEKLIALFHEFDRNKNSQLGANELASLNASLFWKVPRIGVTCISCTEYGGIPPVIFLLSGLETLHLDFQAITSVPVHICRLQNLKVLSISNNPLLESLPGTLGHLPNLRSLNLFSNPSLRTPPHEVVSRGFPAVKAYLKKLAGGFTECRRTKLMLVGLGGAGKTSLLRALMSSNKRTAGTKGENITNGIDILPWTVRTSDNLEVTYNTWDFAGQTLYYNTHQFFLSKRAVYLLLWSTRQGFEHAGLEFWLSSIASHAPKTPILIVGTHCDQVPKADIPMSALRERYPQIAGFHFVSSVEGTGIAELEKELLQVTLELKNMGEKIPKVWLNMEKKILVARNNTSVLPWKVIKEFGTEVGIYDEKDVREVIQFLHELGTVQYFDNEFLRNQVVINPQWIVNVMSCVVSVKNSPIQENCGKFFHKDMAVIWESYPPELHRWLLLLTEEFDLTFPLPDEDINIVPCLLPHEVPQELNWSEVDASLNLKETKFIYNFTYLPAGLFNRAQVRLFQLSDGKMIWKRGSVLKKNKHKALISQISDSELQIKVQGPRPQNVLFLIHEIFESLIKESFHGVIYELLVPCPDCIIKEGTLDPCMFEGSFVRRAKEHKAPFLQCRKYFHTISMGQLYESMPLDGASDIDVQLQNSLTIMQQLSSAMSTDVAIIYSARDQTSDSQSGINPEQIKKDLEKDGLTCWYSDNMDSVSVQDVMLALKNCKVVIVLLSDNFEQDEKSHDLLLYTMDTLVKDFIIVVIGESLEWENTDLGMRIGKQEEMVMIKNKSRYASRVGDMVKAVRNKVNQNQEQIQHRPGVFMSYCWANSRDAQSRGTRCPPEALGWGDPREIKQELEKRGVSCWIDIDQPVAGKGLFKNITEGIRNSQVLVAFVSNEYVKSNNCMMELRFAILNMNLPIVIAAVGTGKEWKQSEVGILIQRSKAVKVYFQEENPKALDMLETSIKQRLPKTDDHASKVLTKQAVQSLQKAEKNTEQRRVSEVDPDKCAFQEEYELMQRKFMRHIISYVTSMDSVPTPRLIVVDFEKHVLSSSHMEVHNVTHPVDNQERQKLQSSFRPKSGTHLSRTMKVSHDAGEDNWESEALCLKVLCEDEKGWHVCETLFPIKMNENMKSLVRGCSAYLARMYAILRQSAVTLNCFDGPLGFKFTSWIDQHALDNVNFLDSYLALRTRLVEDDKAGKFLSQLHRCHLPTGKVYWLCNKHSSGPRITHLSTEVTTRNEVGRVYYDEDVRVKEELEHSDLYKQKKKAKSPSAGIVLPKIMDVLPSESLATEDRQLAFTPLTSYNIGHSSAAAPQDTARTDSMESQASKKEGKSKFCSLQ